VVEDDAEPVPVDDAENIAGYIKEGDKVVYKKYMGTALDEKYLVLREEDILGVL
jgi:co-chaperonin GroES (HSP10)